MFCDIVGSASISERLDSEELRELIGVYHQTCGAVIERFEGHIAQYLGDGVLVYFGYPEAHEDDAVRAVRAGLEIVAALRRLDPRGGGPLDDRTRVRLDVRIGINTGQVVVGEIGGAGRREELALGEVPNVAARIQARAAPNTVVIGANTYGIVTGFFDCTDLGPAALAGISTTVRLFRVDGASSARRRYDIVAQGELTPFVGRDREVALLEKMWRSSRKGRGRIVLLRGEAGIGKTRLVEIVKQRARHQRSTFNEFRCSPEHRSAALYPVIDFLNRMLRFHECESAEEKFLRLQGALASYKFCVPEVVSLMATLLSLPIGKSYPGLTIAPALQKQRTLEALVAWLCEEADKHPVLSIWEDLHWADPSTLQLLEILIGRLSSMSTMAILTCRPAFSAGWVDEAHVKTVEVSRLSDTQVEAMVRGLVKEDELPTAAVNHVVAKTDGVPLFVEELTKMLVETSVFASAPSLRSGLRTSALQHAAPGYVASADFADTDVPSTLQDSLMARLDRLGSAKAVAQVGATIGREFDYELIRAVGGYDDASLQEALRSLSGAELVRQQGVPPRARYVFRHALIRDTAYNSLLRSRKREVHRKVAEALRRREGIEQSQPELLAHHFAEAHLLDVAIEYWQKAAELAVRRSANAEAVHQLRAGLELLHKLPPSADRDSTELSLQVALGAPLIAVQGFASAEVQATFTRARELCGVLHATGDLFPVMFRLRSFHLVKGDIQAAYDIGEELLGLAQRIGDPDLLIEAHYAFGAGIFYSGDFPRALDEFRRMETYYDAERHRSHAYLYGQEPGMACLAYQSWSLAFLGHPTEGAERMKTALDIAERSEHPFSLAFAWTFAALFHSICGHAKRSEAAAQRAIALSTRYGFPFWLGMATNILGSALTQQGLPAEGITSLLKGIGAIRRTGSALGMVMYLRMLAEAYGAVGQYAEALGAIDEAIAMSASRSDRDFDASNIYRVKGELLLARNEGASDVEVAEELFVRELEVSRRQGARPMALRAAMCLAQLWAARGETAAARRVVSEHLDGLGAVRGAARLSVVRAAKAARDRFGRRGSSRARPVTRWR
jgi:class 3 adenylate cyclase/tetratricopeptide (TPR) repeat protein